MNHNDDNGYNPADDDNQGVAQLLAQGEEANPGVAQVEHMSPVTAQGPEPIKEEVNDDNSDTSLNDDELVEEEVENKNVEISGN
jgi:osmotically-inducible protein OsmY